MFESCLWWGVLDTTLCDKVCQWLATGQWISPGTPFTSTNKTDRHDIIEILLKVVLNTITPSSFNEFVNKRLRYTNSISLFNINHCCLTLNSKTRISTCNIHMMSTTTTELAQWYLVIEEIKAGCHAARQHVKFTL